MNLNKRPKSYQNVIVYLETGQIFSVRYFLMQMLCKSPNKKDNNSYFIMEFLQKKNVIKPITFSALFIEISVESNSTRPLLLSKAEKKFLVSLPKCSIYSTILR